MLIPSIHAASDLMRSIIERDSLTFTEMQNRLHGKFHSSAAPECPVVAALYIKSINDSVSFVLISSQL